MRLPKSLVPSCFGVFNVYHLPAMKDPNFLPGVAGQNISTMAYCLIQSVQTILKYG